MNEHSIPPGDDIPSDDDPRSMARRDALATLAGLAAALFATNAEGAQAVQMMQPLAGSRVAEKLPTGARTDADVAARAVLNGTPKAVDFWKMRARFSGISVMAVQAIGGRLEGPPLGGLFQVPAQAPAVQTLVPAFVNGVAAAWDRWAASVKVPGLPWYPAFAAFPMAMAPPMPNIPTPLIALWFDPSPMLPQNLVTAIRTGLGAHANDPGAAQAVDRFTREFAAKFYQWLAAAQVTLVLGKGPIPTFAPPYSPVGPVVGGTAEGFGLQGASPFLG